MGCVLASVFIDISFENLKIVGYALSGFSVILSLFVWLSTFLY